MKYPQHFKGQELYSIIQDTRYLNPLIVFLYIADHHKQNYGCLTSCSDESVFKAGYIIHSEKKAVQFTLTKSR